MHAQIFTSFPSKELHHWFLKHKRQLPWREDPSAYRVWVSEVMLQQTQVSVVVPYFEKWMQLFPSVDELAKAPLEKVLKAWEGLGYYVRARRLHEGAKYLVQHCAGELPQDAAGLKAIKGLGPYTIGAIRSFAFKHTCPAVDGNVMRVLARYFLIEDDISKGKVQQHIWQLAARILPEKEPWIFNEALIELGATICKKLPKCAICPFKATCQGYQQGASERLPLKSNKIKVQLLERIVVIVEGAHKQLLVKKGEAGQVMFGLQEFPYFSASNPQDLAHIKQQVEQLLGLPVDFMWQLDAQVHSFTRYKATLYPFYFVCQTRDLHLSGYEWQSPENLDRQAFSAGHRRIYAGWKARRYNRDGGI